MRLCFSQKVVRATSLESLTLVGGSTPAGPVRSYRRSKVKDGARPLNQSVRNVSVSENAHGCHAASRALALLVDGDNGCSKSVSLAMMCRDGIDSGHVSAKLMSQAFNYRIECTIGR